MNLQYKKKSKGYEFMSYSDEKLMQLFAFKIFIENSLF